MIRYFVFDQFNPSSPTDYWKTEPGVELPDWVCHIAEDEEFIPLFGEIKSSEWGDDDFIAVMKICSERAYLFRVYPGGVDVFGRANRWVILLAEGERKDFTGTDILSAADSGIFADFKSLSRGKNVEVPETSSADKCRTRRSVLRPENLKFQTMPLCEKFPSRSVREMILRERYECKSLAENYLQKHLFDRRETKEMKVKFAKHLFPMITNRLLEIRRVLRK